MQRASAFSRTHAYCQAKARIPGKPGQRRHQHGTAAQARPEIEYEDVEEEELEKFLKEQDISERGFDPTANAEKLIGNDEVDEEQAKAYCRDVIRVLRLLKEKRDMPMREAKLILQIEDPSRDEARKLGVEDARGVSRDEMGTALEQVHAGKVPPDRIALRALHTEMVSWPFLEDGESGKGVATEAPPAELPDGLKDESSNEDEDDLSAMKQQRDAQERNVPGWRPGQSRPPVGRDPLEPRKGLLDKLPDWAGYGTLYAVTAIPVVIAVGAIAILFFSSLR